MLNRTKRLTLAGMLIALGLILPYCTAHGIGIPGTVLLPMHIPVLLIGFLCGPLYGGVCGLIVPVLNSVLTGMPPVFPMLPIMAAELATYGLVSGLMIHKTPLGRLRFGVYPALVISMAAGRVAYGLMFWALTVRFGALRALSVWTAITTGLPGIVVQLLVIPAIVAALGRLGGVAAADALASAKTILREGRATCVVIQARKIVKTECGSGIKPVMALYESGSLQGALVADKIIGKAAAMLLVLGGVKRCYGEVMSRAGYEFLKEHGVEAEYGQMIEHIQNRTKDGVCPMEQTVETLTDPAEGYKALQQTLARLAQQRKEETSK